MEAPHEAIRKAIMTLAVSLVIAAGVLGWAMPNHPHPAKYEGFVVDDKIVRLDTRSGNIVACDFRRCVRVLGNGKDLQPNSAPGLAASPSAAAPPAEPAAPALQNGTSE